MNENSRIMSVITNIVQHYNHDKYWRMREYAVSSEGNKLLKIYCLFRIKRMDAFNGASFGTHIGYGARFLSAPELPHGIRGIFVSNNAVIGKNARIYQQVTIGEGKDGAPTLGDNVFIGAGAKIIGNINVGDNVKIGANAIVCTDIPSGATVVMEKPRVIIKEK